MTMRDLRTHEEAQHLREIREDEYAWNNGKYITLAVMTALDTAFNGKKATTKYPEKSFLTPDENEDLTQEEYEEKVMREQIASMEAMIAKEKLLGMPEVL